MADIVDLEYIKGFLGLLEDDTFDEDIDFLIPVYTKEVTENIDIESLSENALSKIKSTIGAAIGCHLQKSRSKFRDVVKRYKIKNFEKEFDGRAFKETQNWCDTYDIAITEVEGSYGDSNTGSVKRLGISDEYSKPY
jgi:hypothetical protein